MITIAISGIKAVAVFSDHVQKSRISSRFIESRAANKNQSVFTASVLGSLSSLHSKSFTCVLDFLVDTDLDRYDVILGLDWSHECCRGGMQALVTSVEVAHDLPCKL
jgi:hypothetical protein